MPEEDLWPTDFETAPAVNEPLAVLEQQASLLGKKTRNIVTAEVNVFADMPSQDHTAHGTNIAPSIRAVFTIEGPVLGYAYNLFTVVYRTTFSPETNFYPIWFNYTQDNGESIDEEVTDEIEFKELIAKILGSHRARNVIRSITFASSSVQGLPADFR